MGRPRQREKNVVQRVTKPTRSAPRKHVFSRTLIMYQYQLRLFARRAMKQVYKTSRNKNMRLRSASPSPSMLDRTSLLCGCQDAYTKKPVYDPLAKQLFAQYSLRGRFQFDVAIVATATDVDFRYCLTSPLVSCMLPCLCIIQPQAIMPAPSSRWPGTHPA